MAHSSGGGGGPSFQRQVFRPNSRNNDGPRPHPPVSWLMSSYTAHLRFRLLTFPRRPTSQRAAISKAPLSQFLLFSVRKARGGEEDLIKRGRVVGKGRGRPPRFRSRCGGGTPLGGTLCEKRGDERQFHPPILSSFLVGGGNLPFPMAVTHDPRPPPPPPPPPLQYIGQYTVHPQRQASKRGETM